MSNGLEIVIQLAIKMSEEEREEICRDLEMAVERIREGEPPPKPKKKKPFRLPKCRYRMN